MAWGCGAYRCTRATLHTSDVTAHGGIFGARHDEVVLSFIPPTCTLPYHEHEQVRRILHVVVGHISHSSRPQQHHQNNPLLPIGSPIQKVPEAAQRKEGNQNVCIRLPSAEDASRTPCALPSCNSTLLWSLTEVSGRPEPPHFLRLVLD